jgi:hypothetical protein
LWHKLQLFFFLDKHFVLCKACSVACTECLYEESRQTEFSLGRKEDELGRVYDRLYDGNCRIEIKVPDKTQALISSILTK